MLKNFLLDSIRFYQKNLSTGGGCRFIPTCSEYTYEAISRYGIIKGLFLGVNRIIRCNPFTKAGIDRLK